MHCQKQLIFRIINPLSENVDFICIKIKHTQNELKATFYSEKLNILKITKPFVEKVNIV